MLSLAVSVFAEEAEHPVMLPAARVSAITAGKIFFPRPIFPLLLIDILIFMRYIFKYRTFL